MGGGREHDPGAGVSAVVYGDGAVGGVKEENDGADVVCCSEDYRGNVMQ